MGHCKTDGQFDALASGEIAIPRCWSVSGSAIGREGAMILLAALAAEFSFCPTLHAA
ncbi:hypothetical protein KCP76_23270 [Salmonella enterica subsp. enterica serovar Weltevreden]|nr:hypothetical protein KCP76_23270 [Salmonella enterica subsp. enterica serovar Weltevreden]